MSNASRPLPRPRVNPTFAKWTYPTIGFVLATAHYPERYREATRHHPTYYPAEPVQLFHLARGHIPIMIPAVSFNFLFPLYLALIVYYSRERQCLWESVLRWYGQLRVYQSVRVPPLLQKEKHPRLPMEHRPLVRR